MRIAFIGDTHGYWDDLYQAIETLDVCGVDMIIQTGDFGWWPYDSVLGALKLDRDIHFIDGNHEHFDHLKSTIVWDRIEIQRAMDNVYYIPRGLVTEWDGVVFAFMGGGVSIDQDTRTEGYDWFPEEEPSDEELNRLLKYAGKKVDVLVSHDAPAITRHYMPGSLIDFEGDRRLIGKFDHIGRYLKPTSWVHSHYHRSYDVWNFDGYDCQLIGLNVAPDLIIYDTEQKKFVRW